MKHTLFFGLLALAPTMATAQEECVVLENDIARLACFDEAFAARPESSIPSVAEGPEQAYAMFADLVRSESQNANGLPAVVDTMFEPRTCRLVIARAESNANNHSIRWVSGLIFDVGELAAFGPGYGGYQFQMNRGEEIVGYFDTVANGYWHLEELKADVGGYMPWFMGLTDFDGIEQFKTGPSNKIEMITPESLVDQEAISEALANLKSVCEGV